MSNITLNQTEVAKHGNQGLSTWTWIRDERYKHGWGEIRFRGLALTGKPHYKQSEAHEVTSEVNVRQKKKKIQKPKAVGVGEPQPLPGGLGSSFPVPP